MLLGVLAFIFFFGVFAAAILRYGDVELVQQQNTQATAATDSAIEGSALFAAEDQNRSTFQCPLNATLTFPNNETLAYTPQSCNLNHGGCGLCVLDTSTGGDEGSTTAGLQLNGVPVTTTSEVDDSSDLSVQGTGAQLNAGKIGIVSGSHVTGTTGATCGVNGVVICPTPVTGAAIGDPFAGLSLPPPNVTVNRGALVVPPSPPNPLPAGIYTTIDITGGTVVLSGTYVITGHLKVSGPATITTAAGGALLYFTCPTSGGGDDEGGGGGSTGCQSGATNGAYFAITGSSSSTVSVTLKSMSTGPYAGISVIFDRNDGDSTITGGDAPVRTGGDAPLDGSGTCSGGGDAPEEGTSSTTARLSATGQGTFTSDSIYIESGGINLGGSGQTATVNGRVVVKDANLNGCSGTALTINGPATGTVSCSVYDDDVNGVTAAATGAGRALVEALCSGGSGIIDLNYRQP